MNRMYNYLITNGIPFVLNIYPDGYFTFHIHLGDMYIVTSEPFDAVDFLNI